MRNGTCAKCLSVTVYQGKLSAHSSSALHATVAKGDGLFDDVASFPLIAFVCATCGFTEFYVADQSSNGDDRAGWFSQSRSTAWQQVKRGDA